jgi:hypothetical protein
VDGGLRRRRASLRGGHIKVIGMVARIATEEIAGQSGQNMSCTCVRYSVGLGHPFHSILRDGKF